MFTRIFQAFAAPAKQPLPETDARLALGALMVRVAKSDHVYRVEEISQIDRLLAKLNDLNPVDAAKLRATCEKLEAQAPETAEFAALIRQSVSMDQRIAALLALWQVTLADGVRHQEEIDVVQEVRIALGLSEEISADLQAKAKTS